MEKLLIVLRDAAALAGAALVSYGAWSAWHPAGFMIGGVLLIGAVALHDFATNSDGGAD